MQRTAPFNCNGQCLHSDRINLLDIKIAFHTQHYRLRRRHILNDCERRRRHITNHTRRHITNHTRRHITNHTWRHITNHTRLSPGIRHTSFGNYNSEQNVSFVITCRLFTYGRSIVVCWYTFKLRFYRYRVYAVFRDGVRSVRFSRKEPAAAAATVNVRLSFCLRSHILPPSPPPSNNPRVRRRRRRRRRLPSRCDKCPTYRSRKSVCVNHTISRERRR